jgi:CheY-like chemotaxis protein/HPt (histidine-containing phosphotransfer) domain-containing protein
MALKGGFDLILMDMQMRVMDGYTATRALRKFGVKIPIVALTANAMSGFEARMIEAGCDAFLTKPIDIDGLIATLASLLGGKRIESGAAAAAEATVVAAAAAEATVVAAAGDEAAAAAPAITSRLAENAVLLPILRKFLGRLRERVAEVREMESRNDYPEIARFAHWLRGSAGSMGYDVFTAPATELEAAANAAKGERVAQLLSEVRDMAQRVVAPEETSVTA